MRNLFKLLLTLCLIFFNTLWLISIIGGWNWLNQPLSTWLSVKLHRKLTINELTFDVFAAQPVINLNGLHINNSGWGQKPFFIDISNVIINIDLWELLQGNLVLSQVVLIRPTVYLEFAPPNLPNWVFNESKDPPLKIKIAQLTIQEGIVNFSAPQLQTDFSAQIIETPSSGKHSVIMHGTGLIRDTPSEIKLITASLAAFVEHNNLFSLEGSFKWGDTYGNLIGSLSEPALLKGLNLEFEINGSNPAMLYPLTGIKLPDLPQYHLHARAIQQNKRWIVKNIDGLIGASDFTGQIIWDETSKIPQLSGRLKSNLLALLDIGIGKNSPAQNPPPPNEPIKFNANVAFSGKKVITPLIFEGLNTLIRVKNGQIYLDALNFELSGGQVQAGVKLNSHYHPMPITVELRFQRLDLNQLLAAAGIKKHDIGNLSGQLNFSSNGGSLIELFSTVEGNAFFVVTRAQLDSILFALARLDLAKTLNSFLLIENSVEVRCAVAKVNASKGIFSIKPIVIDAATTKVTGGGTINVLRNTLDFTFEPHPKDISLFSAYSPFYVNGSIQSPIVRPKVGALGGRMAAAAALAALVGPIGAVMPFIEPGIGEDNDCQDLVNNAKLIFENKNIAPNIILE